MIEILLIVVYLILFLIMHKIIAKEETYVDRYCMNYVYSMIVSLGLFQLLDVWNIETKPVPIYCFTIVVILSVGCIAKTKELIQEAIKQFPDSMQFLIEPLEFGNKILTYTTAVLSILTILAHFGKMELWTFYGLQLLILGLVAKRHFFIKKYVEKITMK